MNISRRQLKSPGSPERWKCTTFQTSPDLFSCFCFTLAQFDIQFLHPHLPLVQLLLHLLPYSVNLLNTHTHVGYISGDAL